MSEASSSVVVRVRDVDLRYGPTQALQQVSFEVRAGRVVGLIGPDGVGKSSLLALIAGARRIQTGRIEVLGGDMADARHRRRVCSRVAYMPQGLGKNLYPTLSVRENVDFFGRLFGHDRAERERRCGELLAATRLAPFADRPAGQLSGGMRQKLGLCCALIHDPDLLILDEPTTGVDPLSRRQFWELIERIRAGRLAMGVLVATAYMEEAARFDELVAMDGGRVLASGQPDELLSRTAAASLEAAFIALLSAARGEGHEPLDIPLRVPRVDGSAPSPPRAQLVGVERRPTDESASHEAGEPAIEAKDLTKRFGEFVAVDRASFRIPKGEIFGFLGSNGCGKTTTMKMLTGLLPASEGKAWLFGKAVEADDPSTRRRVGYMSQGFSLYAELTVRQNLVLHARLFALPEEWIPARVAKMARRFELEGVLEALPASLPLGVRQRLSLAVAMIHGPELLILDEPTSGVDLLARDEFWRSMLELSRRDGVTIFISTHFMNEAERCDRVSFMHAGRVLVSDTPAAIVTSRGVRTLEEVFIAYLRDAADEGASEPVGELPGATPVVGEPAAPRAFDLRRLASYSRREALELWRDPIRAALALVGSVVLMLILGYGISMDVEDLSFAVLDRDQSLASREYALNLAGSRYFVERPQLTSDAELDRRMRAGELAVAIELPPGFGRDLARGAPVEVGAWIDGSMPQRAETVRGYVQGMHAHWLASRAAGPNQAGGALVTVETRFRYNPDVRSRVAMVPGVIPLLLLLIPAMLAALSVVREKELGSIVNLYVTPVTRAEFIVGKQLPYAALAVLNFVLLWLLAVLGMEVPMTGSLIALALGAVPYAFCATGFGLLISTFTRSQVAAIFGTAVLTMLPAAQFTGLIDPVSSLEGWGALIGRVHPTTHFLTIARGTFSKALHLSDLVASFVPLLIAAPALLVTSVLLLRKQEV